MCTVSKQTDRQTSALTTQKTPFSPASDHKHISHKFPNDFKSHSECIVEMQAKSKADELADFFPVFHECQNKVYEEQNFLLGTSLRKEIKIQKHFNNKSGDRIILIKMLLMHKQEIQSESYS